MTVTIEYDLVVPYQRLRTGEVIRPCVPVRLYYANRSVDTYGLIDSGADGTLFHRDVGLSLGLPFNRTRVEALAGLGGATPAWHFDIELSVANHRFPGRVAFSLDWNAEFGLLGRDALFSAFNVGFDHRGQQVFLQPLPSQ